MVVLVFVPCPPPLGARRIRRGISSSFRTSCSIFANPAQRAKRNLLELISDQDRGLRTQKDTTKRDAIITAIESLAIIGSSSITTGESLSATWRLLWTTEKEQLFIIEKFNSAMLRGRNWEIPLPPSGRGWFETVYMDGKIRVAKDIRGDYLIVDRAPYSWKE